MTTNTAEKEKGKTVKEITEEAGQIKCPVQRALYFVTEFLAGPMCGKCFPCSMGAYEIRLRLLAVEDGAGSSEDVRAISFIAEKMANLSMCKKGKDTADFVMKSLGNPAFDKHLIGLCQDRECKAFIEYRNIQANCIRCGKCQEVCKYEAILGEKQVSYKSSFLPFEIRQKRCTKCGECLKVCPTNAIVVVNIDTDAEARTKA